jgi:hypothetical protein
MGLDASITTREVLFKSGVAVPQPGKHSCALSPQRVVRRPEQFGAHAQAI